MILLPQGRNILIIAASLFVATFSLVLFVMTDAGTGDHGTSLKTSVFEDFFNHGDKVEGHDVAEPEVATLTVDATGLIQTMSHGFEVALGYELKDVKDKSVFTLVVADDLTHFAKDYGNAIKDGKIVVNSGPYRFMSENGDEHVVLITFTPEKKGAMSLIIKDITDSLSEKYSGAAKGKSIKEHQDDQDDKASKTKRIIVEKTS